MIGNVDRVMLTRKRLRKRLRLVLECELHPSADLQKD